MRASVTMVNEAGFPVVMMKLWICYVKVMIELEVPWPDLPFLFFSGPARKH